MQILVVCSANQCRSPMAEASLSSELAARHFHARVESAGFDVEGTPATIRAVAAMAEIGLDLSQHRSRHLATALTGAAPTGASRGDGSPTGASRPATSGPASKGGGGERHGHPGLHGPDLIIGMTRQHVIDVVLADDDLWPRTFTIVDLLARARRLGPRRPDETPEEWVKQVHGGRSRSSLLSLSREDDIVDPVGKPLSAYRRTRNQLVGLTAELAELLAPSVGQRVTDTGQIRAVQARLSTRTRRTLAPGGARRP